MNNRCSPCDPCSPIPIDISTGTYNMYIVSGRNLNKIVSVNWYPAKQGLIIFKMIPWQTYRPARDQATFGITVLDQETFDYQRGGSVTFRLASGFTSSLPAHTYASWPWLFNPADTPLQGWDTGYSEGGGGAY